MPAYDLSKIVSASVVPVVIISACGLLCLAFYNRLSSIVSRLRGFQRERLEAQAKHARDQELGSSDPFSHVQHERMLGMLEQQTRRVIRRARLIRCCLMCLLWTIVCLTVCSIALGIGTLIPELLYVAVPAFLMGLVLLLAAILTAIIEMKSALEPVELEMEFVTQLGHEFEALVDKPSSADET